MLNSLQLVVYQPLAYVFPSRLKKYEELFDSAVEGKGTLKQSDREKALVGLMTTNLLKRLESSVHSFRLTLSSLKEKHESILGAIQAYRERFSSRTSTPRKIDIVDFSNVDEDEILPGSEEEFLVGKGAQISLEDIDQLTKKQLML